MADGDGFLPSCCRGSVSPPDSPLPRPRRESRENTRRTTQIVTKPRFQSLPYKVLHITQHFTTEVASVNQKCILRTYITGCQKIHEIYRNGVLINDRGRIEFTTEGTMHIVTIKKVEINDFGIFLCVCRDTNTIVVSKATLYVKEQKTIPPSICIPISRDTLKVLKHLVSVTTFENKEIMLRAIFRSPVKRQYYWYKNNIPIVNDVNHRIKSHGDFTELMIVAACMADSGVYTCCMVTSIGTLSSVCEVIILNTHHANPVLPSLTYKKITSDITTVNVGEELRIICQCYYNLSHMIRWYHGDTIISLNDIRRVYDDYGDGCVGLRVSNVNIYDEGVYRVVVNNVTFTSKHTSQFIVHVNASLPKMVLSNIYKHTMKPVMARLGDECKFIAEFSIFHSRGYKVIWYVGRHKIISSNTLFNVYVKNHRYVLKILQFLPSMLGDVICELRFNNKLKGHRLLEVSTSYLTLARPAHPDDRGASTSKR